MQGLGDQVLTSAVFAFEQNGGGFTRCDAAHVIHDFAHHRGVADDLAFLGRGLLRDVLDGGYDSFEFAAVVVHLRGAHHDQTLEPVVGREPYSGIGRAGRRIDTGQDAATGLAEAAAKHLLAMLAHHLFGSAAEEFFRSVVHSCDLEVGIVQNESV